MYRFKQLMDTPKFLNTFKDVCIKSQSSPENPKLKNLVENYKENYLVYNQESACLAAVTFWSKKAKIQDQGLWKVLKEETQQKIDQMNSKSLVNSAYGFSETELEGYIAEKAINSINKLDSRAVSSLALSLKNTQFPKFLVEQKRLDCTNEFDVLWFTKAFNDPECLRILEEQLVKVLPAATNTQALCNTMYEFSVKDYYPKDSTIKMLSDKVLEESLNFELKDMNHLLKAFNHKTLYGRVESSFWKKFEARIESLIDKAPVAIVMSYLARNEFYSQSLFSKLIENWKSRVEFTKNQKVFREGFTALAKTPFFTQDLLNWSFPYISELLPFFSAYDSMHILQALVILSSYDRNIWIPLIDNVVNNLYLELTPEEKCILYHVHQAIDIDRPPFYLEVLEKIQPFLEELSSCFESMKTRTLSTSEEKLGIMLREMGFTVVNNSYIHGVYEVDYLVPEKGVVVELLGWPFHISQTTGVIQPKFYMKQNHLKKLGWHVLVVADIKNGTNLIQEAFQVFESANSPSAVHIVQDQLRVT